MIPGLGHVPPGVLDEDIASWDLSGSAEEAKASFDSFVCKTREWHYRRGIRVDVSPLFGRPRHVFTTPEKGTFYAAVKLDNDIITFVKKGRYFCLQGIAVGGEVFELKFEEGKKYMDHPRHNAMSFGGNHWKISDGNPGGLLTGHPALKEAFRLLLTRRGRLNRCKWGIFALHLCEAPRYEIIFQHLSMSIVDETLARLDHKYYWIDQLIHKWNALSAYIMKCLNLTRSGEPLPELPENIAFPGLNSVQDVIEMVRIIQLDALNEGLFLHQPLELPDKWSAAPDMLARRSRDIDKNQKRRSRKRKQMQDAPEPTLTDSPVPLPDDMFHTLNIDGEVKSLITEKPIVSGTKLTRHGWFPSKSEGKSSSFAATRKIRTDSYGTQVLNPEGWSGDIDKKQKGRSHKRKQMQDAPEPTLTDSPVPLPDNMFHTLNIDGEVKSLITEKPIVSGAKLTRHDWFPSKSEGKSASFAATREIRTDSYVTQVLYPEGFTLNIPSKVKLENMMMNKTVRPDFCIKTKTPNEKLVVHKSKSTSRRRFTCDRTPKDNIKDIYSKGNMALQVIRGSIPQIRRVRPIFGMKARTMMIGMNVIQSCALWPRISPVANGKAHQLVLSLRCSASRRTPDCPGKVDIRKKIDMLRPSFGSNSSSTCPILRQKPTTGDGHGGSLLQLIRLKLLGGDFVNPSYCPRDRIERVVMLKPSTVISASISMPGTHMVHCPLLAKNPAAVNGQENYLGRLMLRPIGSSARNSYNIRAEAYPERASALSGKLWRSWKPSF